jgi:hypothetical protein
VRSRLAFEISQCAAIIPPSRIDDQVHVAKACHHEYIRAVRQSSTSKPHAPTITNSQSGSARRAIGPRMTIRTRVGRQWIRRLVRHWPAAGYRDPLSRNVLPLNMIRVSCRKLYLLHASGRGWHGLFDRCPAGGRTGFGGSPSTGPAPFALSRLSRTYLEES